MKSQDLDRMLAALRDEWRRTEAPPRVEAALLGAFRAQAKQRPRRQWPLWGLAAAAAVAVMTGAAVWQIWRMEQPIPILTIRVPSVPPPAAGLWQPKPRPAMAARPVRRAPKALRPSPAAPVAEEVATDFLPLDGALSLAPIEHGQVLRVQVPRSTLVRFGLPVNQERLMDPIDADVVFAQDGIARAIRFVK